MNQMNNDIYNFFKEYGTLQNNIVETNMKNVQHSGNIYVNILIYILNHWVILFLFQFYSSYGFSNMESILFLLFAPFTKLYSVLSIIV